MTQIAAPGSIVPEQGMAFADPAGAAVPVSQANPLPGYSPGGLFTASATMSRPANATPYVLAQLVANATAFGSVVPIELASVARATGEAIRIERLRLRKSGPSMTSASFRVHLFRLLPIPSVGDGAAFDNGSGLLALSDIAGHIGYVDVTMDKAAAIGARGVGLPAVGSGITCEAAGTAGHETSLWALIEARAGYTPASGETFYVTLEGARS